MTIQAEHPDDAINVAPECHEILYEDDKMRVLKVSMKPGDSADMHWHPHSINYVLSSGKVYVSLPDGSNQEAGLKVGEILSTTTDVNHAVKNIGDTTVETIEIELKY